MRWFNSATAKSADPILFIGQVRTKLDENDLWFSDRGVGIPREQMSNPRFHRRLSRVTAKEGSTDRPMSTEGRELAHKVAKLLVEKSRGEEAVAILSAWAASGPNDGPGQELLAEALRLDPGSALAKMAFQRMEGVPGDQALLNQAIATFDAKALGEIESSTSGRRSTERS